LSLEWGVRLLRDREVHWIGYDLRIGMLGHLGMDDLRRCEL